MPRRKPYRLPLVMLLFTVGFLLLASTAFAAEVANKDPNATCLACHNKTGIAEKLAQTVHAKNSCTTCHADRQQIPHLAAGKNLKAQVATACEACHTTAGKGFQASVHLQKGLDCTSCHGSGHQVVKAGSPQSPVGRANLTATCTSCHQGKVAESYEESFHGKAVALGSSKAATCASCHGDHEILAQANAASRVNKANIPATCSSCHETAEPNFAKGVEHYELKPSGPGAPMYFTFKFFTWLTILTIIMLIIHIELELARKLKEAGLPEGEGGWKK